MQPDKKAANLAPCVVHVSENQEEAFKWVAENASIVKPVEQAHTKHYLVTGKAWVVVILQEKEEIRADSADSRELRPFFHDIGACLTA